MQLNIQPLTEAILSMFWHNKNIAGTLAVDYFRPSGEYSETISTKVTFADISEGSFYSCRDYCEFFTKKTGREVPHSYYSSFIRFENPHKHFHHFCRYFISRKTHS